ncbi:MAG TPA: ATPase domain-containing protein [Rhodanobacteraceae bacterium]|jgi:circadian clock protein KaiC|nr:ATPase domain-containing protein [Rhodanobacteraceae bacterium]
MAPTAYLRTGVAGLDDVLAGGFSPGNIFLIEGKPGTGKTTLAVQFMLAGAQAGERGLYITMSETEAELRAGAASHGWDIEGRFDIFQMTPPEVLPATQEQTLLYSSDLELGETTKLILDQIARARATRIVIDSLSEIRLLAQSSLRYRRQILALKHYFAAQGSTVLMLDDLTSEEHDKTVHSIAHAVVKLEELVRDYGPSRRRLRVTKYRGHAFRAGFHDFAIRTGGVAVFPRLVAAEYRASFARRQLSSGSTEFDQLLGGGVETGSSTLILGPAGTGKSTLAMQFMSAAIGRGEKCAMFVFDEELGLLFARSRPLGFDLEAWRDSGLLHISQVDAAELSPGEFTQRVRDVMSDDLSCVVIDSLNGYRAAMPDEFSLTLHMHELLQFLNRRGVATFLTLSQHGVVGDAATPVELTYLADTVVLLRYFEASGAIRRAVSVIKKRTGAHEQTIREFHIHATGLAMGRPLTAFRGILDGRPVFVGETDALLEQLKT